MNKNKNNRGFTMIELIIVIAVLGILAAFALPRFANFTTNAQTAAKTSIAGSLNASLGVVRAKWIADGSNGTTVDFDGNSGTTNDVVAVTTGGVLKMDGFTTADCQTLVNILLQNNNGLTIAAPATPDGTCLITGSGYTVTLSPTGAN